jgi:prophage DNA circulation protein
MISTFVKSKALEQEVATVSRQRIALTLLSNKVDKIQSKIDGFVKRVQDATSGAQLSTIQDALSQCYGNIEKLQNTEIDAIVTGKNTTRILKKQLSKRIVTLLNIIEGLVTEIKIRRKK